MATLKEFEDALRQHGMVNALAILETLKKRDREKRSIAPARRVVGRKMTAELARTVLEMHASTGMTQQEIAFKLGVNQGRVNEVIKRGKWLSSNPVAPEAVSRDRAMQRLAQRAVARREPANAAVVPVQRPYGPAKPAGAPTAAPSVRTRQPDGVTRPGPVKPPRAAELPLDPPARAVVRQEGPSDSRPSLRRAGLAEAPPIVSAQLAFLDL